MKLCVNCKHAVMPTPYTNYHGVPMCAHPDAKRSPVDGDLEERCSAMRQGSCGPDGGLFEKRETKPEPRIILKVEDPGEIEKMLGAKRAPWWKLFQGL